MSRWRTCWRGDAAPQSSYLNGTPDRYPWPRMPQIDRGYNPIAVTRLKAAREEWSEIQTSTNPEPSNSSDMASSVGHDSNRPRSTRSNTKIVEAGSRQWGFRRMASFLATATEASQTTAKLSTSASSSPQTCLISMASGSYRILVCSTPTSVPSGFLQMKSGDSLSSTSTSSSLVADFLAARKCKRRLRSSSLSS